ncbi:integrase [Deinococcus sp. HSC-46F16]|uniref:tyrosine-type recombinase/integrase n=1 Tax=Deinococcus sp. HSC-46F16 TaxID=2910968 RepID=UPI00209C728F|nr:site-specific integrase [Deinococcus sp. HSC-46F16]MCP2014801.1 integrase [Deinococcus sp. HSC-46F16]
MNDKRNTVIIHTPSKRRDRNKYEIKITIKQYDGQTERVSKYGNSKAEVMEQAQVYADHVRQYASVAAAQAALRLTLGDVAQRYIARHDLAPKTLATYRHTARPEGLIGGLLPLPVSAITDERLAVWRRSIAQSGASASAQRRAVKLVVAIVTHAQLHQRLFPGVRASLLTPPRAERRSITYWEPAQAQRALAHVRTLPEGIAIEMMLVQGLRVGEVRGLEWQDIDLRSQTLRVQRQITDIRGRGTVTDPKSRRSRRTLHIPNQLRDRLLAHHAAQSAMGRGRPGDLVAATRTGRPYTRERLALILNRTASALELPRIHVHGLRHTYAAIMRRQGVGILTLSRLMGHADVRTTIDYYAHLYDDELRQAGEMTGFLLEEE